MGVADNEPTLDRRSGDQGREGAEDRRSGEQRRDAFRVNMRMSVFVEAPMQLSCELVDISALGARLNRELPCTPGVKISLRLEIPTYGGTPRPIEIELRAEVVRVEGGNTGLRFIDLTRDQSRAVKELVNEQQRRVLAARRAEQQRIEDSGSRVAY